MDLIRKRFPIKRKRITRKYDCGAVYEGGMIGDVRAGHGTLSFAIDEMPCTYTGGWKDDTFHGYSDFQYCMEYYGKRLKLHYIGEMRDGEFQGHGTLKWEDGITVIGYWNKSECIHGKIITKNGTYFGDIGDNREPRGFGKFWCSSGILVEGEFQRVLQ